jgi:hypothetical protein
MDRNESIWKLNQFQIRDMNEINGFAGKEMEEIQ